MIVWEWVLVFFWKGLSWNATQQLKGMILIYATPWMALKRITRIKKNLKMLHTIWFYVYNILEMANYRDGDQISGCRGESVGKGGR